MALPLPDRGLVFAPVGCGDSITVAIDSDTIIQIDLHQVGDAEDDDDPRVPIVDELIDALPKRDGRPYLAAFGATHLDSDHVAGFARLLEEVTVGDLWFTPRVHAVRADAGVPGLKRPGLFVIVLGLGVGGLQKRPVVGMGRRGNHQRSRNAPAPQEAVIQHRQ